MAAMMIAAPSRLDATDQEDPKAAQLLVLDANGVELHLAYAGQPARAMPFMVNQTDQPGTVELVAENTGRQSAKVQVKVHLEYTNVSPFSRLVPVGQPLVDQELALDLAPGEKHVTPVELPADFKFERFTRVMGMLSVQDNGIRALTVSVKPPQSPAELAQR